MNALNTLEIPVLLWIQNNLRFPAMDFFMKYIGMLNNAGIITIGVSVLLTLTRKYRRTGVTCMISLAVEFILCNLVFKYLAVRIRPYDVCAELIPVIEKLSDYSFPSGHAGSSFAVAMVMAYMMPKKWGALAVVFAVLISFSRIYVGVHYPTDVLAGALLGIVTAWGARMLIRRIWKQKPKHKKKHKPIAA